MGTIRPLYRIFTLIPVAAALFSAGCGTGKEGGGSKNMQNLTAHFNVLYNANEQFREARTAILDGSPDDYSTILPVFNEPQKGASSSKAKALDSVLLRADVVINGKSRSDYVDDAWMLKGMVNYYRADFFTAVEFFNYVYHTWYDDKLLRQQALVWKARSMMRLNDMDGAAEALDSVMKHVIGKDEDRAEAYAAEAQFNIRSGNLANAASMLRKALEAGSTRKNTIRRSYVLAQLEESLGNNSVASGLYGSVVKSNASFELAFNANLNRLRLADGPANDEERINGLLALTKQFKNRDFLDQVYYRVGELYLASSKKDLAAKNFLLGLQKSTTNTNQKGLLYLKLADFYFGEADFIRAKAYYDSTLTALSADAPSYERIRVKSTNLDYLASRLKEAAKQDTLQMLSKLPESELQQRVALLVREQLRNAAPGNTPQNATFISAADPSDRVGGAESKFYFNNTIAIAQGAAEFKKKWGNRKPGDNWRRSSSPGELTQQGPQGLAATPAEQSSQLQSGQEEALVREMMNEVPVTPAKLEASQEKLVTALYDIAGFYKDELKEEENAAKRYMLLLERFPGNKYQASVYYNLYRLYLTRNPALAESYRRKLVAEFPESLYAKVILDPGYAKKLDQHTTLLNEAYTEVFNAYSRRDYPQVISLATRTRKEYGVNNLSPQFDYLAALAAGHLQKIGAFEDSLRNIATGYPADKVVVPLVRQQMDFIKANRAELEQRAVALIDRGPDPVQSILAEQTPVQQSPVLPVAQAPQNALSTNAEKPAAGPPPPTSPVENKPQPVETEKTVEKPAVANAEKPNIIPPPKPLYDLPETGDYYYVINVTDAALNLNPSRFGLGQYIRSNYAGTGIRHQTRELPNANQLIFVGKFGSLADAKAYGAKIRPLLKDIMKVPAGKYDTFVITAPEFDKLNDRQSVERYAGFYLSLPN